MGSTATMPRMAAVLRDEIGFVGGRDPATGFGQSTARAGASGRLPADCAAVEK